MCACPSGSKAATARPTPKSITEMKQPTEGELWEWRAFGRVSDSVAAAVRAFPIRMGMDNLRGEDLYFVSPFNDQNVKLRKAGARSFLKLKPLFEKDARSIELYSDTATLEFNFPVSADRLLEAAGLLGVTLSDTRDAATVLDSDEFIQAMRACAPPLALVRVLKKRSQFEFPGGWFELADATFPRRQVESLSIHSPEKSVVEDMIERLNPGNEIEPMNYVEACRRWG